MVGRTVRLIVSDAEGCVIPGLGRPWDLDVLAALARYNRLARASRELPRFTVASGRPVQYVEALGHAIALDTPACCENGAILFDPATGRMEALFTEAQRDLMARVRREMAAWLRGADGAGDGAGGRARLAPGKEACVTLIPQPPGGGVEALLEEARTRLRDRLGLGDDDLTFTCSAGAVDITPAGVDKGAGVRALAARLGIPMDQVLAIGDSRNDLPLFAVAGRVAAPANAHPEVRARSDDVASEPYGRGVLEILRRFVPVQGW